MKDVSMIFILEIAPQVTDFIFEGIAISNFYHSGDYWWLAFTLVPILLPGMLMSAKGCSEVNGCAWFCPLFFPITSILK
jgi:hypothetical protein